MKSNKQEMWAITQLAYKIVDGKIPSYTELPEEYTEAGFTPQGVTAFSAGFQNIHSGMIGIRRDGDIAIGFKGTEGISDWINDFIMTQVPFAPYGNGKVHTGFFDAVNSIKDGIVGEAKRLFTPGKTIYVAGHSKGGAMATLMAQMLRTEMPEAKQIVVYTFASPRVGDQTFKDEYSIAEHYRYEAFMDLVPHLPLTKDEMTLLERMGSIEEQTKLLAMPPYCSVGKRIGITDKEHLPYTLLPPESDDQQGETLNSFSAVEYAIHRNDIGMLLTQVHNKDYR